MTDSLEAQKSYEKDKEYFIGAIARTAKTFSCGPNGFVAADRYFAGAIPAAVEVLRERYPAVVEKLAVRK